MDRGKKSVSVEQRARQSTPEEVIQNLLQVIRSGFYSDLDPKKWFQDRQFILKNVVLWPATWLDDKGVTLSPDRYKAIIYEVIQGIKHHGKTEAVGYWPGYLKHCLQQHFIHHGDEIYEEAKSFRATISRTICTLGPARQAQHSTVKMAEAFKLIQPKHRQTKRDAGQLHLL